MCSSDLVASKHERETLRLRVFFEQRLEFLELLFVLWSDSRLEQPHRPHFHGGVIIIADQNPESELLAHFFVPEARLREENVASREANGRIVPASEEFSVSD